MPPRRRTDPAAGRAALDQWLAAPEAVDRDLMSSAVRWTLEELTLRHPGHTVEVRIPPFGAVQCLPGATHRRGTPPNVVETDATTWLGLVTGTLAWSTAVATGRVSASGSRADLSHLLPL